MIFFALLLPALALAVAALGLAALASRRAGAMEAGRDSAGRDDRRLHFVVAGAVTLGTLLIALPLLYFFYVMVTAPPFD